MYPFVYLVERKLVPGFLLSGNLIPEPSAFEESLVGLLPAKNVWGCATFFFDDFFSD
jgi:hypothetical protein